MSRKQMQAGTVAAHRGEVRSLLAATKYVGLNRNSAIRAFVVFAATVCTLASPACTNTAPPASDPAAPCTAKVVDTTTDKVLDHETVMHALNALERDTGTDVYVRAFQTTPGDPASWWRQAYSQCPAWLAADGQTPKSNVLVIEFGMNHTSAIEYGSGLHRLDPHIDRIRAATLGDGLRRGDYTAAVTSTLRDLGASLATAPTVPAAQHPSQQQPSAPAASTGGGIANSVARWSLGLLSCASIALAAILGYRRLTTWIEHRRLLTSEQDGLHAARAVAAVAVTSTAVAELKNRAEAAITRIEGPFPAPSADALEDQVETLKGQYTRLEAGAPPHTLAEIRQARNGFVDITQGFEKAKRAAENLADRAEARAQECTREVKLADLTAARDRAGDVLAQILQIASTGFNLEAHAVALGNAQRALEGALETLKTGHVDRPAVDAHIATVDAECSAAAAAVHQIHGKLHALDELTANAKHVLAQYESAVPDVAESTRIQTLRRVRQVNDRIIEQRRSLLAARMTVGQLSTVAGQLREMLSAATAAADSERRTAQVARDAKRREQEAQARSEASKRRRRRGSYGGGYSSGYGAGSYYGGYDSGYSGGGDFGGGSSGSW